MGWKSTIDITRDEAIAIISEARLEELDNATLADIVELVCGGEDHGHNYRVVSNKND